MPMPYSHQRYVDHLLDLYRCTPGTTGHVRPADRQLALALGSRGIPLDTVRNALLLAVARRNLRPHDATPLQPIRSLYYILPIIDELLANPPDPAYFHYLHWRLASLAPALVLAVDHQFS
jgi:hypothetical protein